MSDWLIMTGCVVPPESGCGLCCSVAVAHGQWSGGRDSIDVSNRYVYKLVDALESCMH